MFYYVYRNLDLKKLICYIYYLFICLTHSLIKTKNLLSPNQNSSIHIYFFCDFEMLKYLLPAPWIHYLDLLKHFYGIRSKSFIVKDLEISLQRFHYLLLKKIVPEEARTLNLEGGNLLLYHLSYQDY